MITNTLFGLEPPDVIADDGVAGLHLGCPFKVDRPARLAGFRRYGWGHRAGSYVNTVGLVDHWGLLRDGSDAPIYFVAFERVTGSEPPHTDAWRDLWIHPRLPLLQDTQYTMLVWSYHMRYGYWPGRFDSTWTHDHLEVFRPSEGSPAGRYSYSDHLDAGLTASTAAYAVDVLIETED